MHKILSLKDVEEAFERSHDKQKIRLILSNMDLEDVSIISSFSKVQILNLNNNWIKTLSYFGNLFSLRELYLKNNLISSVKDIDYLTNLKDLLTLDLSENPVAKEKNYRAVVFQKLPQVIQLDVQKVKLLPTHSSKKLIIKSKNSDADNNILQGVLLLINELSVSQMERLQSKISQKLKIMK